MFADGGLFEGVFKDDEIYEGKLRDAKDNVWENK